MRTGEVLALEPLVRGELYELVTVVAVVPAGRARIRFPSGAEITVSDGRLWPRDAIAPERVHWPEGEAS